MLKAVSYADYKESGCINCGCEFCYGGNISGYGTTDVTCGECGTKFVVLADGLLKSSIGYGTNQNDDSGEPIFEYPILGIHPRKGIQSHKFVRPDVRPENGIGDFCNPRGVGYDLACFVKSKEAGQRITDMINKVNEEYENKGFSCRLDYREDEPLWIQVKINYPNELRGSILAQLIGENGDIITEEQVRNAMDMKIDFANYWKYESRHKVYNAIEICFMHSIVAKPEEITKEQREEAYECSFQRNNFLDQFEVWGAYKQIELEIAKGKTENAVLLARHLIDLNRSHFNYELMLQRRKDMDYITDLRSYFHDELVKSVNMYYNDTKQTDKITAGKETCDYCAVRENFELDNEMMSKFTSDWQKIVPMIFSVADLEALKMSTEWEKARKSEDIERENQILGKYTNLYSMFSLFGLYVQVSRELETNNYVNAVLAIKHVADQFESPLFLELQNQIKNNDTKFLKTQAIYCQLINMAKKFYLHEQDIINQNSSQVKKLEMVIKPS